MDRITYHREACQLVKYLMSAITNVAIYPPTHPHVLSCIREAHTHLTGLLAAKREITLACVIDQLLANEMPLVFQGSTGDAFIKVMRENAIDRLTFRAGLPREQLERFIRSAGIPEEKTFRTSQHITVGRIDLEGGGDDTDDWNSDPAVVLDIGMGEPEQVIEDIYRGIEKGGTVDVNVVQEAITGLIESINKVETPLALLSSLKSADEYTFTHVLNVGILTLSLAEALGFGGSHLEEIGIAAMLHDIGKAMVPDEILQKKGRLSSHEFETMQGHTVKGAKYLMDINGIPKLTVLVALEHHIKCDGTGYPHVGKGWKTNIVSQMVSIADVFDALRTRRPYREPMTPEEVEKILLDGSGSSFSPVLLDRFLKLSQVPAATASP